jgi:hypothetical protein
VVALLDDILLQLPRAYGPWGSGCQRAASS